MWWSLRMQLAWMLLSLFCRRDRSRGGWDVGGWGGWELLWLSDSSWQAPWTTSQEALVAQSSLSVGKHTTAPVQCKHAAQVTTHTHKHPKHFLTHKFSAVGEGWRDTKAAAVIGRHVTRCYCSTRRLFVCFVPVHWEVVRRLLTLLKLLHLSRIHPVCDQKKKKMRHETALSSWTEF